MASNNPFGALANNGNSKSSASEPDVAVVGDPVELAVDNIHFLALNGDSTIPLIPENAQTMPPPHASLLAIANRRGMLAASGGQASIELDTTAAVRDAVESGEDFSAQITISTSSSVSHLAFSADESHLLVGYVGGVAVYSLDKILAAKGAPLTSEFEFGTSGAAIKALRPNPVDSEVLAVLTVDGNMLVMNLSNQSSTQSLKNGVTCFAWSRMGKHIICGLKDGSGWQMAPDGAEKAVLPAVPDLDNHYMSSIVWLENHVFLVSHTKAADPASDQPPEPVYHILTRVKESHQYQRLADPPPPFGLAERSPPQIFSTEIIRDWGALKNLVVCANTVSTDLDSIARFGGPSKGYPLNEFFVLELEETRRISMPSHNYEDTSPIGMALDLSATKKVQDPIRRDDVEESDGPLPIVMVLTHNGRLAAWHVVFVDAVEKGVKYEQMVVYGGAQPPKAAPSTPAPATPAPATPAPATPAPATPAKSPFAAGSAFGQAVSSAFSQPAASPAASAKPVQPAFGSSSFGQPAASASPFGKPAQPAFGQSSFGAPSTPGSGQANPAQPAFGQSSFGQPSALGKPSFGQSSFGQPAASSASPFGKPAQPSFGTSSFGAPSTPTLGAGKSGSGFGAYANKNPFGAASSTSASPFGTGKLATTDTETAFGGASNASGFGQAGVGGFKLSSGFTADPSQAEKDDGKPASGAGSAFGSFGLGLSDTLKEESMEDDSKSVQTPSTGFGQPAASASPFAQTTPQENPFLQKPGSTSSPAASATPNPFANTKPVDNPFANKGGAPHSNGNPFAQGPAMASTPLSKDNPFAQAAPSTSKPAESPFGSPKPAVSSPFAKVDSATLKDNPFANIKAQRKMTPSPLSKPLPESQEPELEGSPEPSASPDDAPLPPDFTAGPSRGGDLPSPLPSDEEDGSEEGDFEGDSDGGEEEFDEGVEGDEDDQRDEGDESEEIDEGEVEDADEGEWDDEGKRTVEDEQGTVTDSVDEEPPAPPPPSFIPKDWNVASDTKHDPKATSIFDSIPKKEFDVKSVPLFSKGKYPSDDEEEDEEEVRPFGGGRRAREAHAGRRGGIGKMGGSGPKTIAGRDRGDGRDRSRASASMLSAFSDTADFPSAFAQASSSQQQTPSPFAPVPAPQQEPPKPAPVVEKIDLDREYDDVEDEKVACVLEEAPIKPNSKIPGIKQLPTLPPVNDPEAALDSILQSGNMMINRLGQVTRSLQAYNLAQSQPGSPVHESIADMADPKDWRRCDMHLVQREVDSILPEVRKQATVLHDNTTKYEEVKKIHATLLTQTDAITRQIRDLENPSHKRRVLSPEQQVLQRDLRHNFSHAEAALKDAEKACLELRTEVAGSRSAVVGKRPTFENVGRTVAKTSAFAEAKKRTVEELRGKMERRGNWGEIRVGPGRPAAVVVGDSVTVGDVREEVLGRRERGRRFREALVGGMN